MHHNKRSDAQEAVMLLIRREGGRAVQSTQYAGYTVLCDLRGLPSGTTSPIPLMGRFRGRDQLAKGKTDTVPATQVVAQAKKMVAVLLAHPRQSLVAF